MVYQIFGANMKTLAKLTNREREIAELSAWGACKKEIASHLYISVRTVENHFRHIYEKTGCCKANELSAWWFCTRFRIPFSMSPLARSAAAIILLCIHLSAEYHSFSNQLYKRSNSRQITRVRMRLQRNENNYQTNFAA